MSQGPTQTAAQPPATGSAGSGPIRALTLERLRDLVLGAVRAETSVHMAIGNLNPPPSTELRQDYSRPDGDLEVVFSTEPGRPPAIVGRRVDGEVYVSTDGEHFDQVPAQQVAQAEGGVLVALLRTDVLEDFTAMLAATVDVVFGGEDPTVGTDAVLYRLEIDTSSLYDAAGDDTALGVPRNAGLPRRMPARLWLAPTGLPLRLEMRYSEPLGGIEGTGTVRIDYSRWSEPVDVERP